MTGRKSPSSFSESVTGFVSHDIVIAINIVYKYGKSAHSFFREISSIGYITTEFTINFLKQTQTHITLKEVFSSRTLAG